MADRLGKTQKEILEMGAEESQNWIAYIALQNPEFKEKILKNISIEKQKQLNADEVAARMRAFLNSRFTNG